MKLLYGNEVVCLPGNVLTQLDKMEPLSLSVLIWLCSDPTLWEKPKQLAKLTGSDEKTVRSCMRTLSECGLVDPEGEAFPTGSKTASKKAEKSPAPEPKVRRADVLPNYTSTEIGDLLEARANMRALVDEAQRVLGKMFSPGEINILVGLTDYLAMDDESILLLLAYCKKIGKTNLRSIEKLAFDLSDLGVKNASAMEAELRRREAVHSLEGEIRSMFGLKDRELTSKESKFLNAWVSFGYGSDVIRLAYEITVDATGSASFPYANTILEKWHAENLNTPAEINVFLEAEKAKRAGDGKKKPADRPAMTSYDTDDFFEAALQRSFEFEKKQ